MDSALAALIGLVLSIVLIIIRISPVYSLILGAITGGLLAGWGLETTVKEMIAGVQGMSPAILRIVAAGVLTGMLVKTGAATRIAHSIINALGQKFIYLALALSAMILTAIGVFIDVAVITIAPIAIISGCKLNLSRTKLLIALIGGGKCGNIISPNPNTIAAAENFNAALPDVMMSNIIPAIIGLIFTVFIIVPMIPKKDLMASEPGQQEDSSELPSLWASLAGPLVTIALMALRPICDIVIDPMIALPAGGVVGIITTRNFKNATTCISYGLEKMSGVAMLLIGTGTIAGIITASSIKDVLVNMLAGIENGGTFLAPISGAIMSAATASTTAGAAIASDSFGSAIIAAGVSAAWGAAMVNSGATVLDHLPHGSFFHATGGTMGMNVSQRLKLIPYETFIGLVLALCTMFTYMFIG